MLWFSFTQEIYPKITCSYNMTGAPFFNLAPFMLVVPLRLSHTVKQDIVMGLEDKERVTYMSIK